MYPTRVVNGIQIKKVREKDYYCFEQIIEQLEKKYHFKWRDFFNSELFEDSSKNEILSEDTYKEYKEMIDKVVAITTEIKKENKRVPCADSWYWISNNGVSQLCPKTKTFRISTLIKRAEDQKAMVLSYWHIIGNTAHPKDIKVSTKWLIEGILIPLQKEYGDKLRVYFSKWC